jgi:hypothetical protein
VIGRIAQPEATLLGSFSLLHTLALTLSSPDIPFYLLTMELLSIALAIVGLIAAAARMTPMLYHFITHAQDAPKTASQIHDEMTSIRAALERL